MAEKSKERANEGKKLKNKNLRNEFTKSHEIFVNELIKGSSQRNAFLKAFPKKVSWQWSSIDSAASTLFKQEKIQKRYNELLSNIRIKEQEKTQWTREQAIDILKDVIKKNKEEHDRIQLAINDEIEVLLESIHNNPGKAEKYTKELLAKRKARITSNTYNTGIINAVSELNKMEGFNESNINFNGSILFSDEDKLEE